MLSREQPTTTYQPTATAPTRVVAFDTDLTIDYAGGPVPLDHVTSLRDTDGVLVWATGFNQTLRHRAEIPGMPELKDRLDYGPGWVPRAERMRLLAEAYPDADRYTVVDDVDLRVLEDGGWRYYHPSEYAVGELDVPPHKWHDRFGMTVARYLGRIGAMSEQLSPGVLHLDADDPRRVRLGRDSWIDDTVHDPRPGARTDGDLDDRLSQVFDDETEGGL